MNRMLLTIIGTIVILMVFTGCSIFTTKGKATRAEEKGRARVVNIENKQIANNSEKLDTIAGLAFGTDYALSKVEEPPKEVTVAMDMNKRVISLSGNPTLEKMKEMQELIDNLTSQLSTERKEGKLHLEQKDAEITALQAESKLLAKAKESEIRRYMLAAQEAAAAADAYKSELDELNSWLGLGAVWYGLKKFFVNTMWILGIGGLIFLVLRIAATSNPVCGAIFGVLEQIVAWFINAIKVVFPKALEFAGQVSEKTYAATKALLSKIIDNIQNLKETEKKLGRDITLKELFAELEKSMGDEEKAEIAEIKKELGY